MPTNAKARRSRIAESPLDVVIPRKAPDAKPLAVVQPKKIRFTVHVREDVVDAVRNAAVFLSGPPHRMTLVSFAESAFRREIERLQKAANKGKPFPQREYDSRGGRPIRL